MTLPVGASRGTLSHATAKPRRPMTPSKRPAVRRPCRRRAMCDSISCAKDFTLMELQGQASHRGYAMAALLVSLGVMAVLMTAALPVWRQEMQREKEAELVFRGESYARAIARFQRKMGPGVYPATLDILVEQR